MSELPYRPRVLCRPPRPYVLNEKAQTRHWDLLRREVGSPNINHCIFLLLPCSRRSRAYPLLKQVQPRAIDTP